MARILIVEQDPADPNLWRYNLAGEEGRQAEKAYVLLADMADRGTVR